MESFPLRSPFDEPLAFRLRESVECHMQRGKQPVLLLRFPLKVIAINRMWTPVLERLGPGDYVPFHKMAPNMKTMKPHQVEEFLNGLVFEGFLEMRGVPEFAEFPTISVIVNANEPKDLISCLKSLDRMDYPKARTEIRVAGPVPEELTQEVREKFPKVHLLHTAAGASPAECRNLAAAEATGEFLAFTDARCMVLRSWLKELLPAFREPTLGAVGGGTDLYYEFTELDQYMKFRSEKDRAAEFVRFHPGERFIPIAAWNFLVRRSIFRVLKGFREDLANAGEADFFWRIQEAGHGLEYRPIGKVLQLPRHKFIPFLKQSHTGGLIEPVLQKLHPGKIKPFLLPKLESLFWILVIMAFLLHSALWLLFAFGFFMADAVVKYVQIRRRNLPIGFHHILFTALKTELLFLNYCCSFVSRHYLLLGLLLLNFLPVPALVILLAHLTAGMSDYGAYMPQMGLISFFFYFSIEQITYQAGLWRGCFREKNFNPLWPRIIIRKDLWMQDRQGPVKFK